MAKSKPAPAKKPASKSSSAKPATKPAAKPSKPAPKAAAKPVAKAPAKPAPKPSPKPAPVKKSTAKATKPTPAPATAKAPTKPAAKTPDKPAKVEAKAAAAAPAPAPVAAPASPGADGKTPSKGITVVSNKPVRKPKPKILTMPVSEPLLKPGSKWKPLIQSGPKAPPSTGVPGVAVKQEFKLDPKAKLAKKDLERYSEILRKKRAELLGDLTNMEDEALRQNSGSLSSMPQHMADQGSDTFDQTMSLSLADVDRNLIREIDDALKRIDDGTYGVCLHTGKRIPAERLEQVPWTKYTIEAARELERKPLFIRENAYAAERASAAASANQ
ncbi:MAG: TraR/DksA C4-type zinc finger protein [Phycisphaerales bacterium]|nr:TraR/DksA C4-type zinc finger protein [Phycisphaerales bacterium]